MSGVTVTDMFCGAGGSSCGDFPAADDIPPVTDAEIDKCSFRMFDLAEIARAMSMDRHVDGGEYVVLGNKRERMAQLGNAVTPPAMQILVERLLPIFDEAASAC